MKKIGSIDDNKYYFAVSQKSDSNSDDVIVNTSAQSENFNDSPENDIFDVVDTANFNAEETSEDASAVSKTVEISNEDQAEQPVEEEAYTSVCVEDEEEKCMSSDEEKVDETVDENEVVEEEEAVEETVEEDEAVEDVQEEVIEENYEVFEAECAVECAE